MFDVRAPLFLILLVAMPVLIFVQRRAHLSTVKWRKRVTFFLRGGALLCAILALANLHRTHKEQRLAVVFLIDTSESIQATQSEAVSKQIDATVAKLKPTDTFGIISFAREARVLLEMRQKQNQPTEIAAIASLETLTEQTIRRDGTDVLTALKRAIALLPDGYHRRIVLFSDGIHNVGGTSLKDYLPLFSASHVELLTVPLDTVNDAVRVVQLQVPSQVRKGQSFEIGAVIETDGSLPTLTATLHHNGRPMDAFEWTLSSGIHSVSLTSEPEKFLEEGNHRYTLKLNVADEVLENNQGHGVVTIQDKPHALYVEGDPAHAAVSNRTGHSANLETVLEENGLIVETISPTELPVELVELQRSHVLILSNVSVERFSSEQLQSIENYVRDLGHGFIVIGGERAYGPGGYTDTALERILPVEMTPRERKDAVAIVFVLDTSGSMANYVEARQKIGLAIEGIRAGIRNLDAEDEAGILGFNVAVHTISDLTSDHDMLRQTVSRLKPTGGTTKMKDATKHAYEMLKANDAKRKHIVLLSDGKSDGDTSAFLDLAEQIAEAQIGITTIAVGDANKELLTQFAEKGGGRAVFVENIQQLPAILTEAVRETQRYIVQEPFQPVIKATNESIVAGIGMPPRLHGYVATSEKETAQVFIQSHKDEPILAGWHVGLGKAIAWTSDAKPAWAKEWIPWHNFGKFWGQVINWTLPAADTGTDFDLRVSMHQGVAEVNINTRSPSEASYKVHVVGPDRTNQRVDIQQITPTRYSGTFQTQDRGAYIVTAKREGDARRSVETLSLPYPAEYAEFQVDTASLRMLAAGTAGIYEPTPTQITAPAGTPIESQASLAQALLVIAAILFVLEMILRRFSITNRYLTAFLTRFHRKPDDLVGAGLPHPPAAAMPSTERDTENTAPLQPTETSMTRLLAAKRRAR
ncbi:VWA domain-containing protein [Candidatus Poribacteria bacterium]|nr:VWA domain-containing protein [Candidatus Poribacteria bacterium]MYA56707.1 VWA domain-containing protein [Candidatus Poribacteria bacterium]